jgi:hypothetical protein
MKNLFKRLWGNKYKVEYVGYFFIIYGLSSLITMRIIDVFDLYGYLDFLPIEPGKSYKILALVISLLPAILLALFDTYCLAPLMQIGEATPFERIIFYAGIFLTVYSFLVIYSLTGWIKVFNISDEFSHPNVITAVGGVGVGITLIQYIQQKIKERNKEQEQSTEKTNIETLLQMIDVKVISKLNENIGTSLELKESQEHLLNRIESLQQHNQEIEKTLENLKKVQGELKEQISDMKEHMNCLAVQLQPKNTVQKRKIRKKKSV